MNALPTESGFAFAVHNLKKVFGTTVALDNISLGVQSKTLVGLIGADGAGKTTLMRILATLIAPDQGSVTVLGNNALRAQEAVRTSLGYMPQRFSLYQDLTVLENIAFFADIFGISGAERTRQIEKLLGFARLGSFAKRRAGDLSGGMKQKLALCCALIHKPALLLLDEPSTGVDPVSRREFWNILRELVDDGVTVFVSTPYMDEAEQCGYLALMHRGALIDTGSPHHLCSTYPCSLNRVIFSSGDQQVLPRVSPDSLIRELYSAGGEVRVSWDTHCSSTEVLEAVNTLFGQNVRMEQLEPTVEDVFVHRLMELEPES